MLSQLLESEWLNEVTWLRAVAEKCSEQIKPVYEGDVSRMISSVQNVIDWSMFS